MNVLHVSFSSRGGAGVAASRIAAAQRAVGIDAETLFQSDGTATTIAFRSPLQFVGATVDYFLVRRSLRNPLFSLLRRGGRLDRMVGRSGANVVHLHWIPGSVSLDHIEARLESGGQVAFTLHDMWQFTGGCHHRLLCENISQGCVDCPQARGVFASAIAASAARKRQILGHPLVSISAPSKWMAAELKSAVPGLSRIAVIPNPVDTELFYPKLTAGAGEEFVMAICASDLSVPTKQVAGFAQHVRRRRSEFGKPVRLLAIGQRLPSELSDFEWVTHVQPKSERQLADLLAMSDLLVSASLVESFGYTIAEAAACGTPSVVLDGGAAAELVEPARSGKIAQTLDELLRILVELSHTPDQIYDMGVIARASAKKYLGYKTVADQFNALYRGEATERYSPEPPSSD